MLLEKTPPSGPYDWFMEGPPRHDWRPPGWADWTQEQRRIWRLEQQLLRWEAIGFEAGSLALENAVKIAASCGEEAPSRAEIDRLIIDRARAHWTGTRSEAFDLPLSPESE
jgi:hypothetical protein